MSVTISLERGEPRNPGAVRRGLRALAAVPGNVIKARKRSLAKPTALTNMAKMPLTVAGGGCLVAAAATVSAGLGLFTAAVALIVLEYLAADET